jgi:hypothetical protein
VDNGDGLLIPKSLLTTKGDLIGRSSSVPVRVGVGSDGQVLTADAASTAGFKWAAASGGGGGGVSAALPTIFGTPVSGYSSSSTPISLTVPASVVAGDLIVVFSGGNSVPGLVSGGGNATNWAQLECAIGAGTNTAGVSVGVAGSTSAGSTVSVATGNGFMYAALFVVRSALRIVSSRSFGTGNAQSIHGVPLYLCDSANVLILAFSQFRHNNATITSNLANTHTSANNGNNLAHKTFSGPGGTGMYYYVGQAQSGMNVENACCAIAFGG